MQRKRSLLLAALAVTGTAVAGPALIGGGAAAGASDDPGVRIIGGHEAKGDTDFMVSLQYDAPAYGRFDRHTCGGALSISRDTVITAAHCVTDVPPELIPPDAPPPIPVADKTFQVRIGSKDRAEGGIVVPVASFTVHPDWRWGLGGSRVPQADIAVVRLAHRVNYQPVQLGGHAARPGQDVTLYGWGIDSPDSAGGPTEDPLPRRLQQLDTHVVPNRQCRDWSPMDICINNPWGTDGVCSGDSGSPAIRYVRTSLGDVVPEFVGVVSRGGDERKKCGESPGVFTSAPDYRDWIYSVVRSTPPAKSAPATVPTVPVTQPGERP